MLLIVLILMTGAAILAVLWPLARSSRPVQGGSEIAVYQDQLAEIGRDRNAGLIGEVEAEAARIEVSRRLLAAADAPVLRPAAQSLGHRRAALIGVLIVLSLLPCTLYAMFGSPDVPGQPAMARRALPADEPIARLVAQVEARLTRNPGDGQGWEVLAPVYMRLGRFDDAVAAWRKALALNGETAIREASLGEALVAAANGIVTPEAKQIFTHAMALDAHDAKARYFLGLADEQEGNREAAAATWRNLIAEAPANAPWVGFVRAALARVSTTPPAASGPSPEQMAAAEAMTDAQRTEMIRGMVGQLAARLHADGTDVEDWLKLVRAYAVLGDADNAKAAAADARHALAQRPDDIKRIDQLVKGLGLEG